MPTKTKLPSTKPSAAKPPSPPAELVQAARLLATGPLFLCDAPGPVADPARVIPRGVGRQLLAAKLAEVVDTPRQLSDPGVLLRLTVAGRAVVAR